jgi:CDP-glucose 4,6-dehydratase
VSFPDPGFWSGKRVLLTGHTGFKGAWLTLWLAHLGAQVRGYALPPDTSPSAFNALALEEVCHHEIADIRDAGRLASAVAEFKPDVVFHLAAQALVLRSYREPAETFETNVQGTVNLLQACRGASARAIVVITSDKCYLNLGTASPYREDEPLGGEDPYSASKACAELVVHAWRRAFFNAPGCALLASGRAGNIFGGGDWGDNRLIPDAVRAFSSGKPLVIRRPHAVRPWQYVTAPLAGYILLAEHLWRDGRSFALPFNFGPLSEDVLSVRDLANAFGQAWGGAAEIEERPDPGAPHEAEYLMVDSTRARQMLRWRPAETRAGLRSTAQWYKAFYAGASSEELRQLSLAMLAAGQPKGEPAAAVESS